MAGPATVELSETTVPLVVTTAYTVPCRPVGIVTVFELLIGTNVVFNPLKSARNVDPLEVSLNDNVAEPPAVGVPSTVKDGKGVNGNEGFDAGQLTMNCEARVKTSFGASGTSNEPDHGIP